MQDLVLALKMKHGTTHPEDLIRAHRVKVFLDKVEQWGKVVLENKKMNREDKEMFFLLQEATNDLVEQIHIDKEKAYGWAAVAAELQERNTKLQQENSSLKAELENLSKNIEQML